ncbi:MAG: hypothetical protein V4565_05105 [Bacteroidota bacterium]
MIVDSLVDNVAEISEDVNYWFVRTDYGKYFETFYNHNFIAIGWDNITLEELRDPKKDDSIRKKLYKSEKLSENNPSHKRTVSSIVNKLHNFLNLKKGDVIIIPSQNSSRFAFGIIQNSQVYTEINNTLGCDYHKRKKVKWVAERYVKSLDPHFYMMKKTRHTISDISDYSVYIDNIINSLYIKNDNAHFVLDIKTQKDINVDSLVSLINNIQDLNKKINGYFNLNEQIDKNSIRLNLQSPGQIEFKMPVGKSLVTLATILSITCCSPNNRNTPRELEQFIEANQDTIDKIRTSMDVLEVNRDKINSFSNGR